MGPDHLQKIRQPRPAKAPDNVPSLDANMPRVLPEFGQRLDLRQRVVSRLLHCAANGEGPIVEIHSGIVDVIAIDRKPGKRREFGIVESARQVAGAEEPGRSPIAESEPGLEQRLLELRNGKSSERQHWAELEQFTTIYAFELPAIGSQVHLTADDAKDKILGSSKSDEQPQSTGNTEDHRDSSKMQLEAICGHHATRCRQQRGE